MWLVQLAWKNLWRNKTRTAITIAAIFFAVLLSVLTSSLKTGIFDNLINNVVSFYSGYIQVHKKGYWEDQLLDNSFLQTDTNSITIRAHSNIVNMSPRLESFALASTGEITKGCLVVGVIPDAENAITKLAEKLIQGEYLKSNGNGILISEGLLKRTKLALHDTLVLIGQGYHGTTAAGKYPINGVVKFGSPDLNDKLIYMPLFLVQEMYGAQGMITSYALALNNVNDLTLTANNLREQLGDEYEVMTWGEMMPDIKQHIGNDSQSMLVVQAVLYLLISFGIFGTLLMMMAERRFELGMLVAIGMKKSKLAALLLFESVLTVLLGCGLGIVASIPVVFYFNKWPIQISGNRAVAYERFGFEAIFPTSLDSANFISQGIIVLVIGLVLSLYPIYVVWKLNAIEAMRK